MSHIFLTAVLQLKFHFSNHQWLLVLKRLVGHRWQCSLVKMGHKSGLSLRCEQCLVLLSPAAMNELWVTFHQQEDTRAHSHFDFHTNSLLVIPDCLTQVPANYWQRMDGWFGFVMVPVETVMEGRDFFLSEYCTSTYWGGKNKKANVACFASPAVLHHTSTSG